MIHKKLIYCSFLALFQIVGCMKAGAIDFIKAEDEEILWVTEAHNGQTAKAVLMDMSNDGYNESEYLVIDVPTYKSSLGVPLHAVKVPDEINARAALYDNPELIKTNYPVVPSTDYDYEVNPRYRGESSDEAVDMELMMEGYSPKMIYSRQEKMDFYKNEIRHCMDGWNEELGIEISLLNQGNLYENTAYLSQAFEEIELCYDNIGLDIIDEFYGSNNDVLRDYNKRSADFHVNGINAGLDTRYCGENCSVEALAKLQMDKFSDFRAYLFNLLKNAPVQSQRVSCDKNANVRVVRGPLRGIQNTEINQQMIAGPQTIRVRTSDGQIKYVRLNNDDEYELVDKNNNETMKTKQPKAVSYMPSKKIEEKPMRFDYDGVPLIDEDDL